MGVISDTSLEGLLISQERFEVAKRWFEKRDWNSINGKILIHPFNVKNLGPFSYDLCVGSEVFSLRTQQKTSMDQEAEIFIEADDVVLVLTQEYIGLPREFAASVIPRFCYVRKGIFQSMTKIDPTWFGRIAVSITNRSGKRLQLRKGLAFSTLIINRLDKPCSRVLDPRTTPALGKESIEYFLRIGEEI